jgi:hypothetical protein
VGLLFFYKFDFSLSTNINNVDIQLLANIKKMNNEEIIGTWRSKDFALHTFGDSKVITLNVPDLERATLWVKDKNNLTLVQGNIAIQEIDDDIFEINFNGDAIHEKFNSISSRMHMKSNPQTFLIDLPDYGVRYMEKIN